MEKTIIRGGIQASQYTPKVEKEFKNYLHQCFVCARVVPFNEGTYTLNTADGMLLFECQEHDIQSPTECQICGKPTKVKPSSLAKGWGKFCSIACRAKGKVAPKGEDHAAWKGDQAGYSALHYWINRHGVKPDKCEECGEVKRLEACNISGEYKRELTDWRWMCRSCHMKSDGRMKNLTSYRDVCPECDEVSDARTAAGLKCGYCAYGWRNGRGA